MKKLLFSLLAALPLFMLGACSDDNDNSLPDVDFNITMQGATNVDGTIYIVQGQALTIESITVVNNEPGKEAMISGANFYWDGYFLGYAVEPPYAFVIQTSEDTRPGKHVLEITAPVLAVDKELANALIRYNVVVVTDADQIPEGGTTTLSIAPQITHNDTK